MKALGNKGYILCEFKYNDKSFAFCSGHLTAGENEKKYKDRTNLLNYIQKLAGFGCCITLSGRLFL